MLFAQVSWVPITAISGSPSAVQENTRHCAFLPHPPVPDLSCWYSIQGCPQRPGLSPASLAVTQLQLLTQLCCSPEPCRARSVRCSGSCCPAVPEPQRRGCAKVPALRLLSPTLSFLKVRNTETTPFSFQIMEGDRNSWPRFLWVDITTLQRCLYCTYRDISWLTLTACGIARSQEFAETEFDLNVHQNYFSINRTIFGKHIAPHKERSAHGPPSTWAEYFKCCRL